MKRLILALLPAAFILLSLSVHQDRTVTGYVFDSTSNEPLIGALIQVKGSTHGTRTDLNGLFSLRVPDGVDSLIVTYVGYREQTVSIENRTYVRVAMVAGVLLDRVRITGYANPATKMSRSGIARGEVSYDGGGSPSQPSGSFQFPHPDWNTEDYDVIRENRFFTPEQEPLSTFSIDVDGASYSNIRRFMRTGQQVPRDAVRIEEMVNYFAYDYNTPSGEHPLEVYTEMGPCPWNTDHKLLHIGLKGKEIPVAHIPASNLVFLIDVSGSMGTPNKLPLVQRSLKLLAEQMREQDRVAIAVYAGAAGLVLPSTPGSEKQTIVEAIERLRSGGSTAGAAGINLAYQVARENFIEGGNNRIVLATDGDFNIGVSSDAELVRMIEKERKAGIYLTVLGYGMGNYKDNKMQKLANSGNGNHAYIDDISEAKKVLINEFGGTLFTIAKDVKIQVEFNPAKVAAYRLIGYENRLLENVDFKDDTKDAGEVGSGHTVTALYEIIPAGVQSPFIADIDPLRYQDVEEKGNISAHDEAVYVKLRYKHPEARKSTVLEVPVNDSDRSWDSTSDNFRWAASVASFGMILRDSEFKGNTSPAQILKWAQGALGDDRWGYRAEFVELVRRYMGGEEPEVSR